MGYLMYHESKQRGSLDFPLDYYYVDQAHPRYDMPFHWHEEYEILHVLQGEFHLAVGEDVRTMQPGDMAFIAAGSLHGAARTVRIRVYRVRPAAASQDRGALQAVHR